MMNPRPAIFSIKRILPLLFVLTACSSGKNYQRPDVELPARFDVASVVADSGAVLPSWKSYFTDTVLSDLIDRAIVGNFDLRAAIQRVDISRSLALQARRAWLPSFNVQATASTMNPSQNSLNGISLENFLGVSHLEDYTLAGNISWEIDIWGKIRRQKEAALANYLETQEARRAIQTEIVAQVANGYYNLLMMDAQLQVAQRNVALSDSIVSILKLQKTSGEVTELAVQQAIAQRQDAALLIPQLEQAIILQENALHQLAGEMPASVDRRTGLTQRTFISLNSGIPADLLRNRPDVRSSEQGLRSANARVGVAQANFYPSLVLTGAGGLNAIKATEWFSVPASLFGTAAGTLFQPVFQRRALKTQYEIAMAQREQQVIRFRQVVTGAVHEVTNALIKLDKLEDQQNAATLRTEILSQGVRNAQLLFRSGMANYLEVITAQSRALQAELEQVSIVRNQLAARIELYQALGGGWN